MDLVSALGKGRVSVRVRTSAPKTEIMSGPQFRIALKAPPEKGLANKELVRFCSKLTGSRVRIVSGLKSKSKVIELVR